MSEEKNEKWKQLGQNVSNQLQVENQEKEDLKRNSKWVKAGQDTKAILEEEQRQAEINKKYYEEHKNDPIKSVFLKDWSQEEQDALFDQDLHIFFFEKKNAIDVNIIFYKGKQDFYAEHYYNKVMKNDRDPSLNTALARTCYEKMKGIEVKDHVDYFNIQTDEDDLEIWLALLQMTLRCEMLRLVETSKKKIYFIDKEHIPDCLDQCDKFKKYVVPSQDITKDTNIDEKTRNLFKVWNLHDYIHNNLNAHKTIYAALITENILSWRYLYEAMYMGAWQGENERWENYYVCEGQYPPDDLSKYQGIVCSGSHDHAYNLFLPWIPRYHQYLRNVFQNTINVPRFVTICFSHQSTAHSNFGKSGKRKGKMVNRYEPLIFSEEFFETDWVQNSMYLDELKNGRICGFETHGDHVDKMPVKGKLMMSSIYTPINSYHTDKTLSFQFHPEINYTVMYKTFQDLMQTKNEAVEVLQEFDETYEDSNKETSRFMLQELVMQWLKKPWERKDAKEQEKVIAQKAKQDRKHGFLWDIIYELKFIEVEKIRKKSVQIGHSDSKKIASSARSHAKKMERQSPTKKQKQVVQQEGNESTEKGSKDQEDSDAESDLTEDLQSENVREKFKSALPQKDHKERLKIVKQHYKNLPRPMQMKQQQSKPISENYYEYFEKLKSYMQINKQELEKIIYENQILDTQQAFWIIKKIFQQDNFMIYENEFVPNQYFEGIMNKLKFQQKIQSFYPNKKKISYDELMAFIEDWLKYDTEVIVQYDKQTQKIQQTVGRKFTKAEIRDNFKQTIEQYQNMLGHCELQEDQKILKKTIDYLQVQVGKLSTQAQTISRKDTMKVIYQHYCDLSINQQISQGVDQERFILFLKDFKLWGIFINFAQFIQIFNNNCQTYNALQWEEFQEAVQGVAEVILPDQTISSEEKMEKFYDFMNIDDQYKMSMFKKQNKQNVLANSSVIRNNASLTNSVMMAGSPRNMSPRQQNRKVVTQQYIKSNRSMSPKVMVRQASPLSNNIFERAKQLDRDEKHKYNNHIAMRK